MLILKIMGSQKLLDSHPSKSFQLVQIDPQAKISFGRLAPDGVANVFVVHPDGSCDDYQPQGNVYVLENGKTIATFAHRSAERWELDGKDKPDAPDLPTDAKPQDYLDVLNGKK